MTSQSGPDKYRPNEIIDGVASERGNRQADRHAEEFHADEYKRKKDHDAGQRMQPVELAAAPPSTHIGKSLADGFPERFFDIVDRCCSSSSAASTPAAHQARAPRSCEPVAAGAAFAELAAAKTAGLIAASNTFALGLGAAEPRLAGATPPGNIASNSPTLLIRTLGSFARARRTMSR